MRARCRRGVLGRGRVTGEVVGDDEDVVTLLEDLDGGGEADATGTDD